MWTINEQELKTLLKKVETETGTKSEQLLGSGKAGDVAYSRFIVMHLLRRQGLTTTKIGAMLGKHHTAILYGLERLSELRSIDKGYDALVTRLEAA